MPTPDPKKNATATFLNLLASWNIPPDPAVLKFVRRMVNQQATTAVFLQQVRRQKFYAATFPGIVRNDGTLRMTEAQYVAGFKAAKDYAATVGRNLGRAAYGVALANGNSPSEVKAKLQALDSLKTNASLLGEFSDYLLARGVVKQPLERPDLLKFVMKQGPRQWEQEWNTALQSATIQKMTGIQVGKPAQGSDVSYKFIEGLQKELLPGEEVDYAQMAQAASALPASRLYGVGVTKKDVVELGYGGKNAPAIAARVRLALGTAKETATEQRANPQLTRGGMDLGTPRVQATE